jgi:hypothetical protein
MKNSTPDNFLFTRDHLSREEIQIYLEEVVPDEVALPIEFHLTDCAMCRETVDYVRENGFEMLDAIENGVAEKVRKRMAEAVENKDVKGGENTPTTTEITPPNNPSTPRPPARPERTPSAGPSFRRRAFSYSLVAMVAMIAIIGYLSFFREGTTVKGTMDSYFANIEILEFEQPFAGSSNDFDIAFQQYNNCEENESLCDSARVGFLRIPPTDSAYFQRAQAYIAAIDLRKGQYESASDRFEKFEKEIYPDWYRQVRWPLASAYYNQQRYTDLEGLLEEMSNDEQQPGRKKAQDALSDMKKLRRKGLIPGK